MTQQPKYIDADFFPWYTAFFKEQYMAFYRSTWPISKRKVSAMIYEGGENEIGFIWHALTFSLASKIIYNFQLEDYRFCSNYFSEKFELQDPNVLRCIIEERMVRIDEICNGLAIDQEKLLFEYSQNNMKKYVSLFLEFFQLIDKDCNGINAESTLLENINHPYFTSEFSTDENSMSFHFFQLLKASLNKP